MVHPLANGEQAWSEERVTPTSFDMRSAPDANGLFVGDYEGLSALGTTFYPFWSQSDAAAPTYSPRQRRRHSRIDHTPSTTKGDQPASGIPGGQGRANPAVSYLRHCRDSHANAASRYY